jgi:AmmeMemoRadiSam system protein B
MTTQSLPEHIRKPHVRPIQPIQMQKDGKQFVGLRDPAMICPQMMVVPPQVLGVLQHFQGEKTIDDIATQLKGPVDQFVHLAKGLDQVGLLWGPTFEKMESDLHEKIKTSGVFPATASIALGQDEATCRKAIEGYFNETEDPEIEGELIGIVAPHLDYQRGWPNYAAAYYNLQNQTAPDRVVILGTNHFGIGDGVVLSEYGFESPMGRCDCDTQVLSFLQDKLGKAATIDQLDHMPEHSIELQLPWLQYCFGNVPVIAALIPDPLTPMIADDGKRTSMDEFVSAMGEALERVGGKTFFIASSDLSHVGPQFGEPRPVDEQRRIDVEQHDREMMGKFLSTDPEEFLSAMKWNKNPTRWCSVGNMAATLQLAKPSAIELIDYRQAYDDQGNVMVSSAAMALL